MIGLFANYAIAACTHAVLKSNALCIIACFLPRRFFLSWILQNAEKSPDAWSSMDTVAELAMITRWQLLSKSAATTSVIKLR